MPKQSKALRPLMAGTTLILLLALVWWFFSASNPTGQTVPKSGPLVEAKPHQDVPAAPARPSPSAENSRAESNKPIPSQPIPPVLEPSAVEPLKPSTRAQAADGKTVADILRDADLSDPAVRAAKVAELEQLAELQQEAVEDKARRLGVPLRLEGPDHKVSMLYDFRGDEPLYRTTMNKSAAISTGANLLFPSPFSLDGTGVRVGVWDGGPVLGNHQELTGRVTRKDTTSGTAADDHATHVAGTIGASGVDANSRGMASKINVDSYEWTNDYAEMTAAGAAGAGDTARLPMSNHSYGYEAVTADMGRYETEAASVDAVAASLPFYLPFWAAGNEQDLLTANGGFQSITFNGLAKNVLTIGAADDAVLSGLRNPSQATIAYFSSLGPCDDGRIKPDLVANGVDVKSCVATGTAAYDATYSGTSMATPNALGSAALVQQLYAREFSGQRLRASMLKALLIQTADDRGANGPDYTYGWGLINVKAAADLILDHKGSLAQPKMIEGTITSAANTATHSFTWDGVSPIRTTLSWTDPAGTAQTASNSRTPNLKHNLDVKLTAPNGTTIYQPYVMPFVGTWTLASMSSVATTGKNNVDNVEQVYLASPAQAGTYTVTVSLDGALTTASQIYSLIITGGTNVESNPPPTLTLTSPTNGDTYLPGANVTLSASATDLMIGGAAGTVTQVEFFNGTTSLGVDTTTPYGLTWTPPASGTYSLTARATDNEGAVAVSTAAVVTVMVGSGVPVVTSFTPGSGSGGSAVVLTGQNFSNTSAIGFNGVPATSFLVNSSTQITVTVPALATTGPISVANSYGTGTSAGIFTIVQAPVLISQIYGGGSNTGATYRQDYVELYNRSPSAVSLTGWSLQYSSATGTTWSVAPLSGSIAAGKYFLVGLTSGTSGLTLPTPDGSATSLSISATRGKIALSNSTTKLTGSSPLGSPGLQDFVGFGAANASEGSPAPSPSTTTALFRAGAGATDTDDNSVDFAVAAPNPRNSAAGPPVMPVITSPSTASGTVGVAFTYQITASGSPTSFSAIDLPPGLTINTTSGAITGTPSTAGTFAATLSASNAAGTDDATVTFTINPSGGGGGSSGLIAGWDFQTTTTGGTASAASPSTPTQFTANFGTGTMYLNNSNGASSWTAASELNGFGGTATNAGSGFATSTSGASSLALVNSTANGKAVVFRFNMSGLRDLVVSYATQRSASGFTSQKWDTSTDGTTWTTAQTLTSIPTSYGTQTLSTITALDHATTAYLRLTFAGASSTGGNNRLDNIQLNASAFTPPNPQIITNGQLAAVSTTYGSASPTPTSFTVAGVDLTSGITVTPPAGFEVSLTTGSGYAATLIIPGSGAIPITPVYLRLSAGTTAGSYSGDVICSSNGAANVTFPTASSEVRQKLLTVSANSQNKVAGNTLSLGSGHTAFSSDGLVGSESIGSVTLTASGGTEPADPPGSYTITPSAATGGTFDAGNYDIDYRSGTLTVLPGGSDFFDWIVAYPVGSGFGPSDDPDHDGLVNGIESLLGTSPTISNPGLTALTRISNGFTFEHSRTNLPMTDVTSSYEWSSDLTHWTASSESYAGVTVTLSPTVSQDNAAPANDIIQVTAEVTSGGPLARLYVRIKASRP